MGCVCSSTTMSADSTATSLATDNQRLETSIDPPLASKPSARKRPADISIRTTSQLPSTLTAGMATPTAGTPQGSPQGSPRLRSARAIPVSKTPNSSFKSVIEGTPVVEHGAPVVFGQLPMMMAGAIQPAVLTLIGGPACDNVVFALPSIQKTVATPTTTNMNVVGAAGNEGPAVNPLATWELGALRSFTQDAFGSSRAESSTRGDSGHDETSVLVGVQQRHLSLL